VSRFRPIFIVGVSRSGTTMLATILDRHPSIAVPPETQYFHQFLQEPDLVNPPGREGVVRFVSYPRIRDMELDANKLAELFPESQASYRDLFSGALQLYATCFGKTRCCEKSPTHLLHLPEIINWYPEAKVICIIRDGRDVVRSLVDAPWIHNNLVRHCFMWREQMELTRVYLDRYPDSLMIVRYEDLLGTPEKVLKQICDFIGEVYTPEMLEEGQSRVSPEWESRWKSKASQSVDFSNVGKWKRDASLPDVRIMQYVMGRELAHWGYELVDSGNRFDSMELFVRTFIYRRTIRSVWGRFRKKFLPVKYTGLAEKIRSGEIYGEKGCKENERV